MSSEKAAYGSSLVAAFECHLGVQHRMTPDEVGDLGGDWDALVAHHKGLHMWSADHLHPDLPSSIFARDLPADEAAEQPPYRPLDALCGVSANHWPSSSSPDDIERDECACGTPLVVCTCGDQRCFRCDPVTASGDFPENA